AGVVYRAYLDFVLTRDDLDYCTVDADWGCGIIVKNGTLSLMADAPSFVRKSKLASDWFSIHNDDKAAFKFFMQNHKQLLRLISTKSLFHGFGKRREQSQQEQTPPRKFAERVLGQNATVE